jgi:hypothetical protein
MTERAPLTQDQVQELVVQAFESRDPRALAILATASSPLVRYRVACNRYTPIEVLELLKEEKDILTGVAARVNIQSRRKK